MPLSDLTKKSLPDKVNWSTECEVAFNSLKKALCESPVYKVQISTSSLYYRQMLLIEVLERYSAKEMRMDVRDL